MSGPQPPPSAPKAPGLTTSNTTVSCFIPSCPRTPLARNKRKSNHPERPGKPGRPGDRQLQSLCLSSNCSWSPHDATDKEQQGSIGSGWLGIDSESGTLTALGPKAAPLMSQLHIIATEVRVYPCSKQVGTVGWIGRTRHHNVVSLFLLRHPSSLLPFEVIVSCAWVSHSPEKKKIYSFAHPFFCLNTSLLNLPVLESLPLFSHFASSGRFCLLPWLHIVSSPQRP